MDVLNHRRLTALFLSRLSHLVVQETIAATLEEQAMVNKAILSTYRDLYAMGMAEEAKRILVERRVRV